MMSNRARRMMTHHLRNRADAELNLIPMIDILSVLVAFLLVYSTEVEVVQNTKGIEIPESIVTARPRETVVVMLTKDELFVQGERVASIADIRANETLIIAPLRDALKRPRLIGQAMAERELAEREVTVMADKTLPYEILKKVMSTCTDADFGKISFATLQKDKALDPSVFKPL
jgi:biopolymer transport protein TolR